MHFTSVIKNSKPLFLQQSNFSLFLQSGLLWRNPYYQRPQKMLDAWIESNSLYKRPNLFVTFIQLLQAKQKRVNFMILVATLKSGANIDGLPKNDFFHCSNEFSQHKYRHINTILRDAFRKCRRIEIETICTFCLLFLFHSIICTEVINGI